MVITPIFTRSASLNHGTNIWERSRMYILHSWNWPAHRISILIPIAIVGATWTHYIRYQQQVARSSHKRKSP